MKNLEIKVKDMSKTSIVFSILFLLIGLFLLFKPEEAMHLVSYALGIMLLVWGIISITKFLSNKESENYLEFNFILGVFVFIFGIIILIKPNIIASIIPLLIGIWMLINGVTKLSYSLTINKRVNSAGSIIVSILILVCAILLIFNPFSGAKILTQIIGSIILLYSVLDLLECILIKKTIKKESIKDGNIIEAEFREK